MVDDAASGERPLPLRTPLAAVADPGFDRIAGVVQQVIGVPVALVSLVDRSGQVFPGAVGLPDPWDTSRATPLSHSFCQHVVRSGQPLIVTDARTDPRLHGNLAIEDLRVIAYAGIPLADADGSVVGSLCAIDTEPRTWTDSEIRLLTDLAAACSAELQLRSVAISAERAELRAAALLHLSETLSATSTIAEVSAVVRRLAVERLGAFYGGVTVVDPHTAAMASAAPSMLPIAAETSDELYASDPLPPSAVVARTGEPETYESLDALRARYPRWSEPIAATGAQACVIHPLLVAGRTLGTVVLLWDVPRAFDPDDLALYAALCGYTAQAVQRAELLADRRQVAATLQSAMLPVLPHLPWLELAGRYLPARTRDAVGGDWYDALALHAGELALSVGDVEGHDTVASSVMGQLRSTVRALTVAVPGDPANVLSALDDVLAALPPQRYATGVLATLSSDGTFCWTNAAHPPPVVLAPGRPPELLRAKPQLPVGLKLRQPRTSSCRSFPPGTTVLLYTDGLVERRDRDIDDTLDDLLRAAGARRELPVAELVDAVLDDLVADAAADVADAADAADDRNDDDIVVFAVRLSP